MASHPVNKGRGRRGKKRRKDGKSRGQQHCCCNPCTGVSLVVRGMGRCLFVGCYPVIRCFGLDERRHHHHHHRHLF